MKNKKLQIEINKLVEQSFSKGKADNAFISKVSTLMKKQPTAEAIQLLSTYTKGLKTKIAENTLLIESTIKLSSQQLLSIQKLVNQNVYATDQKLNPSLLGGIKLKIGSQFIDLSIQSKINQVVARIKD